MAAQRSGGGRFAGIGVGGILVIIGVILLFTGHVALGIIIALIGLVAFGGFAKGQVVLGSHPAAPDRALLLDLDGTLVDTAYLHALAWQRALSACGYAVPAYSIHRLIGMGGASS